MGNCTVVNVAPPAPTAPAQSGQGGGAPAGTLLIPPSPCPSPLPSPLLSATAATAVPPNIDSKFSAAVTKTIEIVDGLENAINCRNKNDLFFHLKELEKLSLASIDNSGDPAEVSRRLLGILGLESIQSVDPRLKRLLASIAHRFMQKLYVLQTKGNAQQQLLRSTLEQWRDTLSAFSSLASDEDNGWRYEVECMQSLVQMMTRDTNETKEEDTLFFASRILQVLNCTFINPDPAQVLGLLQEIAVRAGQVAVDRGQQAWYSKVVASNSLALLVVSLDPQTTPNYVQTVSSVIQEVEKSLQKALDRPLAASWKTIYTDLCTLQYILLNISNSALQEACISGIPGSNCPGIQTFTRFSRFRIAHNWRVREKTAEILLLALDEQRVSSQNQELIRQILAVMGLSETDKRVKLTLSNAGSVQELAATLKKSWEKSKPDLELALEEQKATLARIEEALVQARATKSAEVGGLEEEKKVAQNQWSIAQEQVQSLGTELAKQLSAVFDAKIAGLQHSIDSLQTSLAPKKLPALVTGLVQAQAVELKEEHSRVAQTHVVSRVDEIQSIDAVVDNFLSTTKRVLLVWGAPGGGKHDACIHTLARLSDRVEDTGVAPVYVDVPALMNPTKGLLRETLTNYYIFRDEDVATVRREARLVLLLDGFDEIDLRQNLLLTNQLDRWERVQFIIFCSTSILQTVPDCRKFFTLNGSVADDKMIECSLQGFDDRQASLFVDKFLARGGHDPAIKEAVLRELRPHLANPCMSQFLLESVVENWGQICGAGWTEQEKKTISSGCSKKWCQRKQLKLLRAGKSYEDQEEEIKKAVNGFEPLANLDQAWKLGDNAEQSAIKAEPALKKAVVTAGIRSGGGNRSIRASFGSEIEEASNLYWIDQFGRDVDYGQVSSLFPAICQNSYISHAWKFVDKNGRVQAVFRADGIQYMYNVTLTSSTMESVSDSLAVRLSTEKSSECKVPTVFSVQNNSDEALEVFWLGYDHKSKPKTRGVIEPGELLNIDTFISHAFRICAKGQIQKPAATIVAALASIRLEVFSG